MGVLEIGTGLLNAAQAPFGLVKDLATSNPFQIGDRYEDLTERLGQIAENTFGPDRGLGAAFGLAPEWSRAPVRLVTDPLFAGMELARDELISQPLATAFTVANFVEEGDLFAIVDPGKWSEAYRMVEHRSPGQAIALMFATDNIRDPEDVEEAMTSDFYQMVSGTFDAIAALTLDPTVLGAKGVSAWRFGRLGAVRAESVAGRIAARQGAKTISSRNGDLVLLSERLFTRMEGRRGKVWRQRTINEADRLGIIDKFVDDIANMDAAELRAGPFADNAMGAVASDLIAGVKSHAEKKRLVRLMMGATDELSALQSRFDDLASDYAGKKAKLEELRKQADKIDEANAPFTDLVAGIEADLADGVLDLEGLAQASYMLDEMTTGPQMIRELHPDAFRIAQARIGRAEKQVESVAGDLKLLDREASLARQLDSLPTLTRGTKARLATHQEGWYQKGPFHRAVRSVWEMKPHHIVYLDDLSGDVQVQRFMEELNSLTKGAVTGEDIATMRTRYMAASGTDDAVAARRQILEELEEMAMQAFGADAGLTANEIQAVLEAAQRYRRQAVKALGERAYGVIGEGNELIRSPLFTTQLLDTHPLVDLQQLAKVTKAVKRQRSGAGTFRRMRRNNIPTKPLDEAEAARLANSGIVEHGADALSMYYRVWKPLTLLRVGWPIRVVGDEQLRIMAKLGALAPLEHLGRRANPASLRDPMIFRGSTTWAGKAARRRVTRAEKRNQAVRQNAGRTPDGDAFAGFDVTTADGRTVRVAGVQDSHELQRARSDGDFLKFVGSEERSILEELRTGAFRAVAPDEPGFAEAWERAVNMQIRQDALGAKLLAGETVDDVVRWLERTPEGQAHARALAWKQDLRRWVEDVDGQIDRFLPGELRGKAAKRQLKYKDYTKAVPSEARLPVHGEILNQAIGTGPLIRTLNNITTKLYKSLGAQPTNVLSRQPFFASLYQNEMRRMVSLLDENVRLTDDLIETMQYQARQHALKETRGMLYSLAEESRFAEMVRFVAPFYNAWQEVLTVWARLAVENPAFIRQMQIVWRSPEAAGLVTDKEGNLIGADGRITVSANPDLYRVGDPAVGDERHVAMDLPEAIKNTIPGARTLTEAVQTFVTGGVGVPASFEKSTLNLLLQGPPGFGPPVQVPVNEIVKANPSLESVFKFVLPWGATASSLDIVNPTILRRLDRTLNEDNTTRRNQVGRLYFDSVVDWNLGKRPDLDGLSPDEVQATLMAEANDKGAKLQAVRLFAGFFMPVTTQYRSPYQMYIDAYRARKELDAQIRQANPGIDGDPNYQTPDEWFVDTYGDEFFPLTQSLTKSMDGVPPTLEGYEARKEYADLIEQYPELGGLIIGSEGAGEFNRTVYESQLANTIGAGTSTKQRESRSLEEMVNEPAIRRGWMQYTAAMDILDARLQAAGLPNYQVAAARELNARKRAVQAFLRDKYPAWWDEFMQTDQGAWQRKIDGMKAIVAGHPQAESRPDLVGLAEYLHMRLQVQSLLDALPSKSITATSNMQVRQAWEGWVQSLVNSNPMFAATYYRYLENDPLRRPPLSDVEGLVT